jgi:hypothetical protein
MMLLYYTFFLEMKRHSLAEQSDSCLRLSRTNYYNNILNIDVVKLLTLNMTLNTNTTATTTGELNELAYKLSGLTKGNKLSDSCRSASTSIELMFRAPYKPMVMSANIGSVLSQHQRKTLTSCIDCKMLEISRSTASTSACLSSAVFTRMFACSASYIGSSIMLVLNMLERCRRTSVSAVCTVSRCPWSFGIVVAAIAIIGSAPCLGVPHKFSHLKIMYSSIALLLRLTSTHLEVAHAAPFVEWRLQRPHPPDSLWQ